MASRETRARVLDIFPPEPTATSPPVARTEDTTADIRSAQLSSGRTLEWEDTEDGAERVRIRSIGGEIELEVVLTADGPRLRFKAADITLEADGKVQVDCDEFRVQARTAIAEHTGGDLEQRVAGNAVVVAKGDVRMSGRTAGVRATRGDVRLKANDDVKLEGERIKLNC